MKPRITCVIPVFNDRDRLPRAVASALRQIADLQVVVVDDGSQDGSGEVAQELARSDSRIVTIALRPNMGLATARNVGMSRAEGKYVAFLDSDDEHAEGFYAHALHVLERRPELAAVRGHFDLFQPDGSSLQLERTDARYGGLLNSTTWMWVVDRQVAAAIGFPADPRFRTGSEDIVFTHTLLNEFRVAQIDTVAAHILVKPNGHTWRYLMRTAPDGSTLAHAETPKWVHEAIALEVAQRRAGIEAFPRMRDPKS